MMLYSIEKENFIICEAKVKGQQRLSVCEMFLKQKLSNTARQRSEKCKVYGMLLVYEEKIISC